MPNFVPTHPNYEQKFATDRIDRIVIVFWRDITTYLETIYLPPFEHPLN